MKNIFLIFSLAILWALGGLAAGAGFSAFLDLQWTIPCGAINVIAGMVMLLLVTRNEQARRLFYEGPKEDESGILVLALLWALPFTLMFAGLIWWLMAQFLK